MVMASSIVTETMAESFSTMGLPVVSFIRRLGNAGRIRVEFDPLPAFQSCVSNMEHVVGRRLQITIRELHNLTSSIDYS